MRNAPPVQWPVGRCHIGPRLVQVLLATGLALTLAWWVQAPGRWSVAGLAAWLVFGAWAWRAARAPTGVLSWDGEGWRWWADGDAVGDRSVEPWLALDLQGLMLLRLGMGRQAVWLWLTASSDNGRWLALRRALYSRRIRKVG